MRLDDAWNDVETSTSDIEIESDSNIDHSEYSEYSVYNEDDEVDDFVPYHPDPYDIAMDLGSFLMLTYAKAHFMKVPLHTGIGRGLALVAELPSMSTLTR